MVLESLVGFLVSYVVYLASISLFFGAFLATLLETVFPPIPSELVIPAVGYLASLLVYGYPGLVGVIFAATAGATLGATIIYYLSLKAGRYFVLKYGKYMLIDKKKLGAAERWFDKYGTKAVFFGRMVPGVRELISVPAGLSKMRFRKFLAYTFAGSFVWTALLATLGYFLGANLQNLPISKITDTIAVLAIITAVAYLVFKYILSKKPRPKK